MEDLRCSSGRGWDLSERLFVSILMLEIGEIASFGFFGVLAFAGFSVTLTIEAFVLDFLFLFDFSLRSI